MLYLTMKMTIKIYYQKYKCQKNRYAKCCLVERKGNNRTFVDVYSRGSCSNFNILYRGK